MDADTDRVLADAERVAEEEAERQERADLIDMVRDILPHLPEEHTLMVLYHTYLESYNAYLRSRPKDPRLWERSQAAWAEFRYKARELHFI